MNIQEIGTNYFGIRINISNSLSLEELTSYLAKYKNVLGCFEESDKEVKNDHTHILIWGYEDPNFEENFIADLKLNLKGVRGNGRYAIEHKNKDFYTKACQYVCKGKIETLPTIFINTYFTDNLIEYFWNQFWKQNLKIEAKIAQDTNMRNIERIWDRFTNARIDFDIERENEQKNALNLRLQKPKLFEFWYNNCIDYYEQEFKEFDDLKVLGVIQGLMLKSDKELFRRAKLEKLAHLAGLGKFDKQYLMPDIEEN